MLKKQWLYRAARTFVQAVVGYLASNLAAYLCGIDTDYIKSVTLGLSASAVAAGVAAVMNMKTEAEG